MRVRLSLCGWTPRHYSTSPALRAAPCIPLDAAFQLHEARLAYGMTTPFASAFLHPFR